MMELVNLNLAHRWYLRYDLDEPVPDHSSLTKIRERYGLSVFQAFFEEIVEQCIEAGLVWGEELYFDSTKALANAAISNMIPQAEFEAEHHLEQLFRSSEEPHSFNKLVDKYDGKRLLGIRKPHYKRVADQKVSPVDPYASPMPATKVGAAVLGYRDHYVVDGGKARIILRALVTPASIMDNTPMLDLTNWVCERWKIKPRIAVGDSKYGTVKNMTGLEQAGIKAYVPIPDLSKRNDFYPAEDFHYDPVNNQYICPQGHPLPLWSRRKSEEMFVYRSDKKLCNACPVKSKCTKSKSGGHIFRSFYQEYVEKVKTYHPTPEYQKAMSKRAFWVEPLFGEAKDFHRLRRFRLRGLLKVNIEGVMIAAGQNIKRLLQHALDVFCFVFNQPILSFNFR